MCCFLQILEELTLDSQHLFLVLETKKEENLQRENFQLQVVWSKDRLFDEQTFLKLKGKIQKSTYFSFERLHYKNNFENKKRFDFSLFLDFILILKK